MTLGKHNKSSINATQWLEYLIQIIPPPTNRVTKAQIEPTINIVFKFGGWGL